MPNSHAVTVIIPTFNGERYLDELLEQVERQIFPGSVEVLIVDSGSSDKTLAIIAQHPNVKLIEIPNSEFGHGKTRNLAAKHASGEFLVFLTQDAVPAHEYWLQAMLEPFTISPNVQAVFGKQTPRRLAPPLIKYEIQRVFAQFLPPASIHIFKSAQYLRPEHSDFLNFYSDVNSATRRQYLVDVNPFRDVDYAEDLYFAQDTIAAGFMKAYAPMGEVIHSNDLEFGEIRGRAFDETRALIKLGKIDHDASFRISYSAIAKRTLLDARYIARDPELSWRRKLVSLVLNPFMLVQQQRGHRDAIRHAHSGSTDLPTSSLESRKRADA